MSSLENYLFSSASHFFEWLLCFLFVELNWVLYRFFGYQPDIGYTLCKFLVLFSRLSFVLVIVSFTVQVYAALICNSMTWFTFESMAGDKEEENQEIYHRSGCKFILAPPQCACHWYFQNPQLITFYILCRTFIVTYRTDML